MLQRTVYYSVPFQIEYKHNLSLHFTFRLHHIYLVSLVLLLFIFRWILLFPTSIWVRFIAFHISLAPSSIWSLSYSYFVGSQFSPTSIWVRFSVEVHLYHPEPSSCLRLQVFIIVVKNDVGRYVYAMDQFTVHS